jgi:hypothetical protein
MNADATDATHPAGEDRSEPPARQEATRREFLANLRGAAVVTAASGALSLGPSIAAKADLSSQPSGQLHAQESLSVRLQAATNEMLVPIPRQTPN